MHARRFVLSLAAVATLLAGTSLANPYNYKMPLEAGERRSTRSYSVAPGGTYIGTNVARRNYGYRIYGQSQNTHFRADHKVPGLYLSR